MHRGECVTTGGLYRPTHLCVAHLNCTKKNSLQFFLWCGKVGGGGGVWRGRGGGGPCFRRQGFAWGFRGGRGDLSSGLSQPGGKSC